MTQRTIALCSRNPEGLARDVAASMNAGFSLEEIRMFDMFPQAEHVAALAWLSRS